MWTRKQRERDLSTCSRRTVQHFPHSLTILLYRTRGRYLALASLGTTTIPTTNASGLSCTNNGTSSPVSTPNKRNQQQFNPSRDSSSGVRRARIYESFIRSPIWTNSFRSGSTSEKRQRTFYFVCWHTKKMYAAYEKMYAKYKL
jgi:hypothetical protein